MRRPVALAAVLAALGSGSVVLVRASAGAAPQESLPVPRVSGAVGQPLEAAEPGSPPVALASPPLREPARPERTREPLLSLGEEALRGLIGADPGAIGSVALGRSNRGSLFNAEPMPEGPLWHVVHPEKAWGTAETIQGLARAIERVHETFPDTPPLWIGDISRKDGGWLRPHRSHQSGQDVDLGFFYTDDSKWYTPATEANLDRPRTWVLLKTLLEETDVEMVFLDRSIQQLLLEYGTIVGEDPAWLDATFEGKRRKTQCRVRHTWGHTTHVHVRFESRVSRELGERVQGLLVEQGLVPGARPRRLSSRK
jgi:murein endopeptidase